MAKKENTIGGWAFLLGFVLSILFGLIGLTDTVAWILIVLGLIVGFLNISDKETNSFLMAGTVLVIVSSLGADAMLKLPVVSNVLNAVLMLFIPATIIVALKSVFYLAKE